jgi:hypothetical protein
VIRGLLTALLAAVLLAPAAVHAAPRAPIIGIGDQKADMFDDPRFAELGIRHARVAVSWDMLHHDWQIEDFDLWMRLARRAGVEPLVGFWHSRVDRRRLPTPEQFKYEFRRFRARWPDVRTFAVWNEANLCGEPTCRRPALVAAYYRALRKECPDCRILAAEVLDLPNLGRWVRDFHRALGFQPRYWGLHNYIDANRFRTSGTLAMLRAAPRSRIWITETGGIVKRRTKVNIPLTESSQHAARATRWVFDRLVVLSSRLERVYLYHWNSATTRDSWDSGLIGPAGRERPAMKVLASRLGRLR